MRSKALSYLRTGYLGVKSSFLCQAQGGMVPIQGGVSQNPSDSELVLAEVKPFIRRVVEMLMQLTRNTGHQHPHMIDSIDNYSALLMQMGLTQEQATARIKELAPELFG